MWGNSGGNSRGLYVLIAALTAYTYTPPSQVTYISTASHPPTYLLTYYLPTYIIGNRNLYKANTHTIWTWFSCSTWFPFCNSYRFSKGTLK